MYMEAIDVLKMVNKSSLSKEQLMNYFIAYDHVYGELVITHRIIKLELIILYDQKCTKIPSIK